jgi:hypothetical protein
VELLLGIDGCELTKAAYLSMSPPAWVKAFWFPENKGPFVLFNTLIKEANHPYLFFFGADDLAEPSLAADLLNKRRSLDITRLLMRRPDGCTEQRSDLLSGVSPAGYESCGVMGIWTDVVECLGGFLPWRCQADKEFLNRARRQGFKDGLTSNVGMIRGEHDKQLTKAPQTNSQSPVRKRCRALVQESAKRRLSYVVPQTSEFLELSTDRRQVFVPLMDGIGNMIQTTPFVKQCSSLGMRVTGVVRPGHNIEGVALIKHLYSDLVSVGDVPKGLNMKNLQLKYEDGFPEWQAWFIKYNIPVPADPRTETLYEAGAPCFDVVVCPTGADNWPMKKYPHWSKVIEDLRSRGLRVAVCGAEKDEPGLVVAHECDFRGKLTLAQSAGLLRAATVVVANEGGMAHLAAAQGTKTFIVVGGTSLVKNLPPKNAEPITLGLPCQPCQFKSWYVRRSPHGSVFFGCSPEQMVEGSVRCLRWLSPEQVAHTVLGFLQKS